MKLSYLLIVFLLVIANTGIFVNAEAVPVQEGGKAIANQSVNGNRQEVPQTASQMPKAPVKKTENFVKTKYPKKVAKALRKLTANGNYVKKTKVGSIGGYRFMMIYVTKKQAKSL